jgi:hypothetical protein
VYDTASEFGLYLAANDFSCAIDNAGAWASDADGPVFLVPDPPAEKVAGFPRHRRCVLITDRPGPMFVPISQERLLRLRIGEIEKRVANVKEAQRIIKARGRGRRSGVRAVVAANPAFFDQSRPSDIQVLSVFEGCVHDECLHHDLVEKLIAQLDWKALAAIVR